MVVSSEPIENPTPCPDCGHTWWQEGPSGGSATNYRCRKCGLLINVIAGEAEIVGRDTRNLPDAASSARSNGMPDEGLNPSEGN